MAFKMKGTQRYGKSPFKYPRKGHRWNTSGTTGPKDWFHKITGTGRWNK